MKKQITAQEFERAFCSQWKEDIDSGEKDIHKAYDGPSYSSWTEFMLGITRGDGQDAFFYRVLQQLKKKDIDKDIDFSRERNKLDAIYHRRESLLPQYEKFFSPLIMDVIIEHENDCDIEKEMWKLLMFRSPLKVLVCYDYDENEKTNDKTIVKWLKNKLDKLADMAKQVDENWQEAEDTEYLIVIGNRNADNKIIWKFKKLSENYQWGNNS